MEQNTPLSSTKAGLTGHEMPHEVCHRICYGHTQMESYLCYCKLPGQSESQLSEP